ncbi:TRAP transporter substrate-binding protein [Afifella marina]|uniref:TRAP-type mannitol/chloroaromatic compound transport system, substrate-binding protein n=1 Tax=Afifella marina DSM 2698 TaxID=1120955 RepID=A0A1G5N5J1_AFIMA|nr:TRAP transporter substrate-binding protein [Afifella marina]SCZ32705.1 TRAP-type mannitol/chloroaromatic compound transport system, substrate-binding protein [Afifella marina DSM 2698]
MSSGNGISRRSLLAAGAAAAGAGALARPALAQSRIEWSMVTSWPKNLPGPGVSAERIARDIETASRGRMVVQVRAAGEIVPALAVFDAVSEGTAEMAHTASLFWAGKAKAAPVFTAAPFGLTPLEHITWIDHGGGQALWDELYRPFGVKPFMAGNTGFQMGGWYRGEINSLDDFKGLKIRMPGLGGEVARRLGATPVSLPASEILPALQSGTIDATEFLGPWSDLAMGFWQVAKNYYWPGFHEPNGTGEGLVSISAWQELPDDLKAIVRHVLAVENIRGLGEAEWENARALEQLTQDKGVVLRRFPDDFLAAARQASDDVFDELAETGGVQTEIVESYRSARARMQPWSEVSEAALLAARR